MSKNCLDSVNMKFLESRWAIVLLAVFVVILLSGCATQKTVEVKVPVHVTCVGKKPERPQRKFGQGEYVSSAEAAKAILLDYLALDKYALELETQLAGCE